MRQATMAMATATVLLGVAVSSRASAETRQHGAYSVAQTLTKSGMECKFEVGQVVRGGLFHVSMSQAPGMMFIAIYVSSLKELRGKAAILQIDGHEFMRFRPSTGEPGAAVIGVHAEIDDDRMQRELTAAVKTVHEFEVVADDFHWPVPIEGMRQAVDDYVACRKDRWS